MTIIADTHTHTSACDHAYSTLAENITAAAEKGLKFLALTEHSPSMPGAPGDYHFQNLRIIPPIMQGVALLKGVEVNIMDYEGTLDLSDRTLERLDWVVASMHSSNLDPAAKADHTRGWLAVAENPLVDVIGHAGDSRFDFDHEPVIRAFKQHGKIVEINAHSFVVRPGSKVNCPEIARMCARYEVPIVISSDAHHCSYVGRFDASVEMLESIGFPEELILNADYHRFLKVVRQKCGRRLTEALDAVNNQF